MEPVQTTKAVVDNGLWNCFVIVIYDASPTRLQPEGRE